MENQQIKLMLGILKVKETYQSLKALDFSNDVLNDFQDIVDDLMGLVENKEIKDYLLKEIKYDAEIDKYFI
jgi:hypothetical protein